MTAANEGGAPASPVRLLLREVWSRGDLALVDELVTGTYVRHDPLLAEPVRGPGALKATVERYRRAAPDLRKTVEETFVDGAGVVVVTVATGTHEGPLAGVEPTGRRFEVDAVSIYRVEGDRVAEGTELLDVVGLLGQTGSLPGGQEG